MSCVLRLALLTLSLGALFPAAADAQSAERTTIRPAPRVGPPWLGLTLRSQPKEGANGVEVLGLMRRSPADGTAIKVGDSVVAVAGVRVDTLREIQNAVRQHANGDTIEITIRRRNGAKAKVPLVLAPMPSGEEIVRNHLLGFDAPEFTFRFVGDGKDVHLSELRGKPTILDFWATWCGPCHRVQAELADVKAKYSERINIVGVSDESAQVVRAHLERYPARYAMAVDDGDSRGAYAVQSIPMIVLLDAEHRVAAIIFGANQREALEKKLANLLPPNE